MARHSIVEKLQRELEQPIGSERQVVYLLVEIRKLIEIGGDLAKFETLKFCCDWIAHPILTGAMAQQIVRQFDKAHQETETIRTAADGQRVDIDWAFLQNFEAVLRLSTFREQLAEYLQLNGLDPNMAVGDGHWSTFLTYFARIIEDCPLRLRGPVLEHTNEVVLKVADVRTELEASQLGYKLAVEWSSVSHKSEIELKHQRFY